MTGSAPLVLLPGLICTDYVWSPQAEALSASGFDVTSFPGYGLADSFGEMASLVLDAAPPVFSLAGHSMGARVALEVFRQAPGRIERLALLDTGVHGVQPGEREKRMALLQVGKDEGMEALVDTWLPPMVKAERHSETDLMTPMREMCIGSGLDTFEAQITALLGRDDQTPILDDVRCPTLVATGSDDAWSPPEQHEAIAARIPGARLVIFEGAGHMAPLETPDLVGDALRGWLDRPATN